MKILNPHNQATESHKLFDTYARQYEDWGDEKLIITYQALIREASAWASIAFDAMVQAGFHAQCVANIYEQKTGRPINAE